MSALTRLENRTLTAEDVFSSQDSMSCILNEIRDEVLKEVPDLSTAESRRRIASLAYKVARSKTALDDLGKQLVADWKSKSAMVDKERKRVRDNMDALRDEVRMPLTVWENEQQRIAFEKAEAERIEAERLEAERLAAEAKRMAEIKAREDELIRREAALKEEEERVKRIAFEKAEAERIEAERLDREKRITEEAAQRAKRDAALEILKAKQAQEKAERDAVLAVERERERIAKEAVERIEAERLEIEAAARKAAAAPDKEKIISYVKMLRDAINNKPVLATDAGEWLDVAEQKLIAIVDRINQKAGDM